MIAQLIFTTCLATSGYFMFKGVSRIMRNIQLGTAFTPQGDKKQRFKEMVLVAFGQKKMFARPIPAVLHLFVYLGFVIINIELLEIVIDGVFGTHRVFYGVFGNLYRPIINFFEFLALAVMVACAVFLVRRNMVRVRRFQMPELSSFPKLDANLILVTEIALMFAFLSMNACDALLQQQGLEHYKQVGSFAFSQFLTPLYQGLDTSMLLVFERSFWWFHILGIMAFANYLPYSKHLHIMLAFPATYFSNLSLKGKMNNMPVVTREVKSMLGIALTEAEQAEAANASAVIGRFGAKDVPDLTWKNLLDAYTCTECGRCSSVCPANQTGKLLSPRKIMMDTRDRLEEVGRNIHKNGTFQEDGKALYGSYISSEELLACTTCNACTDACPVNLDPLDIILQLRRYRVMEEAKAPDSWNAMFANIENNQAPWKFSPSDRFNWSKTE
jgi:heterodisulfide reductase subunit C